jgi:hypothetical protein
MHERDPKPGRRTLLSFGVFGLLYAGLTSLCLFYPNVASVIPERIVALGAAILGATCHPPLGLDSAEYVHPGDSLCLCSALGIVEDQAARLWDHGCSVCVVVLGIHRLGSFDLTEECMTG